MKKLKEISMFVPACNEEGNIERMISSALSVLKRIAEKYELIVVVYAGSTDNTISIARAIAAKNRKVKIVYQPKGRKGMGIALRMGFESARYNLLFYTDSDNQFDLEEIFLLLPHIHKFDIVAGYRINRQDPGYRIFMADVYNFLIRSLFGVKEIDLDCAFRLCRKEVLENISLNCRTGLAAAELIVKANKSGLRIKQIGVHHFSRVAGTSDVVQPLFGLIKFPKVTPILKVLKEIALLRLGVI